MNSLGGQVDNDGTSKPSGTNNRSRYVPRASQACTMCRLKKAKCDQQTPCSFCQKHSFNCMYSGRKDGPSSTRYSTDDKVHKARARREVRMSVSLAPYGPGNLQLRDRQGNHWSGLNASMVAPPSEPADKIRSQQFSSEDSEQLVCDEAEDGIGDPDIVGDINRHTSGVEFYGMSSNFVLLSQLFSSARLFASDADSDMASNMRISQGSPITGDGHSVYISSPDALVNDEQRGGAAMSSHLAAGRLSIVNLLYNEDAALPPSRPKTPVIPSTDVPASSNISQSLEADFCDTARDHASEPSRIRFKDSQRIYNTPNLSEKNVERKLIQVFFNNLHHLHPFLLVDEFMSRCEREVWSGNSKTEPQQNRKHFIALYNIVIAVGALIAGIGLLPEPETELNSSSRDSSKTQQTSSSIMLSVIYFRKSRVLLGDVFEVCSLESAQTLFLMSLYCQNSLKPHSCYMYSGMAVRTALAIGMPSESMSKSIVARKAARRTWWCIYSHEIDMCSSAGRRDSLRKPESYVIPFPKIKDLDGSGPESEVQNMSMINEMVRFAIVLRKTSKEIYHDSKGLSLLEKSVRALELDEELTSWRRNLPSWLNLDSNAFREPEWASKQKLVLQLRYLNARILIHRPFLASVASQNVERLEANIDPCIDAARKTITLMYDSYAHRYYFRTWWYNSTYTLYAGMILLYIILLNYNKISGTELLRDVEKSHEILLSMKEASVARRSADLMLEVIEIAKTYLARRRLSMQQPAGSHLSSSQFGSLGMEPEMNVPNISMSENNDWQRTLFADDFLGLRRVDMLSTLIDPTILVDFAAENTYSAQNDPFLISGDPDTLGMWASPQ